MRENRNKRVYLARLIANNFTLHPMKTQLDLVKAFHQKFRALINENPSLIPQERYELRYRLMKEEVEEYLAGAQNGDLENIAKELGDILFTVFGTIVEHGLQDKMEAVFDEVCRSNMSKDYHEHKMIKGPTYSPANVGQFINQN